MRATRSIAGFVRRFFLIPVALPVQPRRLDLHAPPAERHRRRAQRRVCFGQRGRGQESNANNRSARSSNAIRESVPHASTSVESDALNWPRQWWHSTVFPRCSIRTRTRRPQVGQLWTKFTAPDMYGISCYRAPTKKKRVPSIVRDLSRSYKNFCPNKLQSPRGWRPADDLQSNLS